MRTRLSYTVDLLTVSQSFVTHLLLPRLNTEVQPTVTITNQTSTILADAVLIVITWKHIIPGGGLKASR